MPRQSYLKIAGRGKAGEIDLGPNGLGKHPELEVIIGRCVMAWSSVEIEMAMILGKLIGAKDAAAIAVFSLLRRSSAQRDAVMEAATIVLNPIDLELLTAFLNVHKAIETERNSLAHGHFGSSSRIKDGLLWMNNNDYVFVKSRMTLTPKSKPPLDEVLSKIYVYRIGDITKIYEDICWMISGWYDLLVYLSAESPAARDLQYRQLSDQPHIAREMALLRKRKSQATT